MRISIVILSIIFLYSCKSDSNVQHVVSAEISTQKNQLTPDPRWKGSEYRDQEWRPQDKSYFFSEMWTWSFDNQLIPSEDANSKGEMSIYVDPSTGTLLLTKNDTKYMDEMIEWIIIHPEGVYEYGAVDEFGKRSSAKISAETITDYRSKLEYQSEDFAKYVHSNNESKTFGTNQYSWPTIEGQKYTMTYQMTNDKNELYLSEVPINMRYLYLVEEVFPDIRLPINLKYGYIFPENALLVSDQYTNHDQTYKMELTSMSHSNYSLNTAVYSLNH